MSRQLVARRLSSSLQDSTLAWLGDQLVEIFSDMEPSAADRCYVVPCGLRIDYFTGCEVLDVARDELRQANRVPNSDEFVLLKPGGPVEFL